MTTTADMQSNAITGPNVHAAPPQTLPWTAAARALIVPCEQRLWRPFWLLLAVALVLRLFAAYYGHWSWRLDEVFQYLEQAHRVVFGYGHIPWEYRYGVRSWLLPALVMPPLYLARALGLDNPTSYAVLVNSWNAVLSMTIPVCSYLVARRLLPEKAARWTLVFTCFWYEFIILAPRTMSEIYATLFFMAGLATGAGSNRWRWLAAGFLLGVTLALRPHFAPLVAIVGLIWLWQLPRAMTCIAIIGGIVALLLWGAVDLFTLGGWWGSIFSYLEYVPLLFDHYSESETHTFWRHLLFLTMASFGLYPIVVFAACTRTRQLWPPLLLIVASLTLYSMHYNQQYSNVFIYLPLLWMLAGGLISHLSQTFPVLARMALVVIFAVSTAGIAGKLPHAQGLFSTTSFFSTMPLWKVFRKAHEMLKEEKDAILIIMMDNPALRYGGYYNLHLNIPVLHLSDVLRYEENHHRLWQENQALGLQGIATHVISFADFNNPAFDKLPFDQNLFLYVNRQKPTVAVADEWVYDYVDPGIHEREKLPPRDYTPYNPDL